MSEPDYAEALRLIRKHMQPGDTLGQMFMRVAKELDVADCTCARAGFPGSCHNCDADNGPIKFWRERALEAERLPDRARIARAICCPGGCEQLGDSEDGEKCYCDTSDFDGSGIEKKTDGVLAALSDSSGDAALLRT